MEVNQAKNLLMHPKSAEHLEKVLASIEKNKREINLKTSSMLKIVNKIIAYEYVVNNFIINEEYVELLRADNDGVWCKYKNKENKDEYVKVWYTSANPDLRKIFFGGK